MRVKSMQWMVIPAISAFTIMCNSNFNILADSLNPGTIKTQFIVRNADGSFVNLPDDQRSIQTQQPTSTSGNDGEEYTLDAQNQSLDAKESSSKANAIGTIGLPYGDHQQPSLKGHKAFRYVGIYKGNQPNTDSQNLITNNSNTHIVKFKSDAVDSYYYVYEPVITIKYVEGYKLNFSNPSASSMQAESPLINQESFDIVGNVGESFTAEAKDIRYFSPVTGSLKGNALGTSTIWDNNADGYNSWMNHNGHELIPATWSASRNVKFGDVAEVRYAYSRNNVSVNVRYVDANDTDIYTDQGFSTAPGKSGGEGLEGTVKPSSSALKELQKQGYTLAAQRVDEGAWTNGVTLGQAPVLYGTSQQVTFKFVKNQVNPNTDWTNKTPITPEVTPAPGPSIKPNPNPNWTEKQPITPGVDPLPEAPIEEDWTSKTPITPEIDPIRESSVSDDWTTMQPITPSVDPIVTLSDKTNHTDTNTSQTININDSKMTNESLQQVLANNKASQVELPDTSAQKKMSFEAIIGALVLISGSILFMTTLKKNN